MNTMSPRRIYRTRRNRQHEYTLEIEHGRETVEYVVVYEVSPGSPGRTYGDPGSCYPAEPPEVEGKRVYHERLVTCTDHRFKYEGRRSCRACKTIREERPELEGLVSDEELLEHAGCEGEDIDWDCERKRRLEDGE